MYLETRTLRGVSRRLLPFPIVCYFVAYVDRVNVGFASLTINRDLGISAAAYGLGTGIFFLTYFIFEVPSKLYLEKFGARKGIAGIMITCGLLSSLAPGSAAEFPVYAPEGRCMEAARARGGTPDEAAFRSCLDLEQQGYDSIKTRWPSLSAYTQTWCHEVATAGGTRNGSYLALDGCVKGRAMIETSPPQQFRW